MPPQTSPKDHPELEIGNATVGRGERRDVDVRVSESAAGRPVDLPIHVWRGQSPGPVVAVTGTVHGDEINGMGAVRKLILEPDFEVRAGTLILVPVINLLGFERATRYMPDRRDLNRAFPGSPGGSLSSRYAHAVFNRIILRADYLVDLHSAAQKRTNFPNVRARLSHPETARLAELFGSELIVNGKGPEGSLRRASIEAGLAAIILEAGEPWKFEPTVSEYACRGVASVLAGLGMTGERPHTPLFQAKSSETTWIRAPHGGVLRFHVGPGDDVDEGQPVATVTTILGRDIGSIEAPHDGVVLGMTTLPTVVPGDPVAHLALIDGGIEPIRRARRRSRGETLDERLRDDLATNMVLVDPDADPGADPNQEGTGI
ncbi:MAG: succinylglutamate desuccinylase/aspartoacylase family protein [Phycisphaerales bacterium JB040]